MNRWIVAPFRRFRGREGSSAMRVAQRTLTVLLIALLVIVPASADKAKSLYSQGADQEALNHFDQAFDLYRQAYELKPRDVQIRAAYERMKFRAAAEHIHKGQLLRVVGLLLVALVVFVLVLCVVSFCF